MHTSHQKNIEWVLVILSSTLLGIWAVKETIALRNILLISGTFFSFYYVIQEWQYGQLKEQCTLRAILPILLVALTFVWVISHFLFFSLDPTLQFRELKSTWVRSLMASIIGLATGLVLRNDPKKLNLLWIGIFISFLILFFQYTPRAISQNKLLVPDYEFYLFHLKFNTVLMGLIFLVGVNGNLFDRLCSKKDSWCMLNPFFLLYWLCGTIVVLWAFVFIVNSRNGIGLSIILYFLCFFSALIACIQSIVFFSKFQILLSGFTLLIFSIGLGIALCFGILQTSINPGWSTLLADAKLAVQIDRYLNWQNPYQKGYPFRDDGQVVTPNNYERVAWATVGIRGIIAYPQGVGVLDFPFSKNPNAPSIAVEGSNSFRIATHSGWVDLGLAFGIPILGLIFSTLGITFIEVIRRQYAMRMTVIFFVVMIVLLYTVAEVSNQHGIEILFYFLTLLPALLFKNSDN